MLLDGESSFDLRVDGRIQLEDPGLEFASAAQIKIMASIKAAASEATTPHERNLSDTIGILQISYQALRRRGVQVGHRKL